MFNWINNFGKLAASNSVIAKYQSLRWRARKPRWLPTAKSKIFRIPQKPNIPEDEKEELKRLYNNYRTGVNSLQNFLVNQHSVKFQKSSDPEEQKRIFQEDLNRCASLNNEWNKQQKLIRDKFISDQLEEKLNTASQTVEQELLKREEYLQEIESIVRQQKDEAKNFIKPEDIDAAIDRALENPVDYNFALDINGQKIIGRENNNIDPHEQVDAIVRPGRIKMMEYINERKVGM